MRQQLDLFQTDFHTVTVKRRYSSIHERSRVDNHASADEARKYACMIAEREPNVAYVSIAERLEDGRLIEIGREFPSDKRD